jgi:hypothetical protein
MSKVANKNTKASQPIVSPSKQDEEDNIDYSDMSMQELWDEGLKLGLIDKKYPYKKVYESLLIPTTMIKYLNSYGKASRVQRLELHKVFSMKLEEALEKRKEKQEDQPRQRSSSFHHKRINADEEEEVEDDRKSLHGRRDSVHHKKDNDYHNKKDNEHYNKKDNEHYKKNNENHNKNNSEHYNKNNSEHHNKNENISELKRFWILAQKDGLINKNVHFKPIFYSFITPDEISHLLNRFNRMTTAKRNELSKEFNDEIRSFQPANTFSDEYIQISDTYKTLLNKAIAIGLLKEIKHDYTMSKIVSLSVLASYITIWLDNDDEQIRRTLSDKLNGRFEKGLNQFTSDKEITHRELTEYGKKIGFFTNWIDKYSEDLASFICIRDLRNMFKTVQYLSEDDEKLRKRRFYNIFHYYLNSTRDKVEEFKADFMTKVVKSVTPSKKEEDEEEEEKVQNEDDEEDDEEKEKKKEQKKEEKKNAKKKETKKEEEDTKKKEKDSKKEEDEKEEKKKEKKKE